MAILLLGLLLFLGVHSLRIFADDWRSMQIARWGKHAWRAGYALLAAGGFALIVWGYAQVHSQPLLLWHPPLWLRHVAVLLTMLAFVLFAAAHVPGNAIKARLGHPMVVGIKTWALAHLLANGSLAALLLFASFLLWAVLDFASLRRRDRAAGSKTLPGIRVRTLLVVLGGLLVWALFAFVLHGWLIGVRPLA